MKNCLFFLAFLLAKSALGQVNDNFSDGDFTTNPVWTGSGFQVNASKQLQTASSGGIAQTVNLVTSNVKSLNVIWEFYIQMDFDPSTSNQLRIYLVSDNTDLNASLNGYFLQIGESGQTDSYDLYRQDGLSVTKIIDGPQKNRVSPSQLIARVQVTRNIDGFWEILTDISGGFNYVSEGTATDLKYVSSNFFGLKCKYSLSNSDKFYFDDFMIGNLVPDAEAPQLINVYAADTLTLDVYWNEPVTEVTAMNPTNYDLNNGYGQPIQVKKTNNPGHFQLIYPNSLETNNYTLSTTNLSDYNFNAQINMQSANFSFTKPYQAKPNDVIINEVYADPSPQIDLPALEFIELWNTSEFPISLDKWTYSDGSTTYTFGNQTLQANEFAILCASADVANFTTYGKVIGLSPWPSLNNSGDQLSLKNSNGVLINQVAYTDAWYKDPIKKQGGWSLELINPKALCTGIQNWSASTDVSGGTPGKTNSVYQANPVIEPLKLLSALMTDSVTLLLQYNRYVDSTSAATSSHYQLNNGLGQPISVIAIGPYFEQVQIKFANPPALGKNYTLSADQVSDCAGNLLLATYNTASFFLAEKVHKNDILINEILFNPRMGGVDFVEIYNQSDHLLDLKDLRIASLNEKDSLISVKSISDTELLIQPKEYRVLTTNPDNIKAEYTVPHPDRLYQMVAMPSFNDDEGAVVLIRADSVRIDQFNYTEKMHFPLIKDPEGISLERSSFKAPANEPGNFRSAAATLGFATPGEQNSQFINDQAADEPISLESTTLSPDNDGFEDALTIHYRFAKPGLVANLSIYSDKGLLMKRLVKNMTLASEGSFVWDGLNDQNERVAVGIYLIHLEVFDPSGRVQTFIKPCVVATKLN